LWLIVNFEFPSPPTASKNRAELQVGSVDLKLYFAIVQGGGQIRRGFFGDLQSVPTIELIELES